MKITIDTDRIPLVALAAMAARYGCEVITHGPGAFCAEQSPKVALMDEYRAHTPRCGLVCRYCGHPSRVCDCLRGA